MSMQQEAEVALIRESVYINTEKREAEAWLTFTDDPGKKLTENKSVALKRLDNVMRKCDESMKEENYCCRRSRNY